MPIAIILGLPKRVSHRLRAAVKSKEVSFRACWDVKLFSSPGKPFEIDQSDTQGVLRGIKEEGPHVLAFKSPRPEDKAYLRTHVAPYFRFRWLENAWIDNPETQDLSELISRINSLLEEEEEWDAFIQPHDLDSPLLIPEICFGSRSQVRNMWDDASTSDGQRIASVLKTINRFKEFHEHRKDDGSKAWLDQSSRIFDWSGDTHGIADYPRKWKFSYAIQEGFHFDVRSATKNKHFELKSVDGEKISTSTYLNVDPHGHIRKKVGQ